MTSLPGPLTQGDWDTFVAGKLASTNERNTLVPANSYGQTAGMSSSEDDDAEFRDIGRHRRNTAICVGAPNWSSCGPIDVIVNW